MKVYHAIASVMADLSGEGIAKDRRNTQGTGYNFRGIDDVYNALSSTLAKHGLVIIPRVLARECVERSSRNGGALFYTTVDVEFDIVSAEDGSKHTARTVGEAMDSGDKSSNKAMSAAYKYMAFQTFCIPTEGDNDADAQTHEVKPQQKSEATEKQASSAEQKRQLLEIDKDLVDARTENDVKRCADIWQTIATRDGWSRDYRMEAKKRFDAKREEISKRDVVSEIADTFPGSRTVDERITDREASQHPLNA